MRIERWALVMIALMLLSGCGETASKPGSKASRHSTPHESSKVTYSIDSQGRRVRHQLGFATLCPKTGSCEPKPEKLSQSQRRDADLFYAQSKCDSLDRACLVGAALKHMYAYDETKAHRLSTVDCSEFPSDVNGFDCYATRRNGGHVEYDVEASRDHTIRVKRIP